MRALCLSEVIHPNKIFLVLYYFSLFLSSLRVCFLLSLVGQFGLFDGAEFGPDFGIEVVEKEKVGSDYEVYVEEVKCGIGYSPNEVVFPWQGPVNLVYHPVIGLHILKSSVLSYHSHNHPDRSPNISLSK